MTASCCAMPSFCMMEENKRTPDSAVERTYGMVWLGLQVYDKEDCSLPGRISVTMLCIRFR